MSNKEIKAALQLHNTKFNVVLSNKTFLFKTNVYGVSDISINEDKLLGNGMNVKKLGSSKMSLYTYTILNKRVSHIIKYKDITILEMGTII